MKFKRSAIAVYALVVAAVVVSAIPASRYLPAELTRASKALSVALPQGWAFFTKDPTEAEVHAYVERDGIWVPIESAQSAADSMGLSRHNRSVSAQIATVVASVEVEGAECKSEADIQKCHAADSRCVGIGSAGVFCLSDTLTDSPIAGVAVSLVVLLLIPWIFATPRGNTWLRQTPFLGTLRTNAFAYGAAELIRVQLSVVYLVAAVAKLAVPQWSEGSALWYWLQVPGFGVPADVFAALAPVLENLGIVFHAGIAVVLGLWSFGVTMTGVLLLCLALQKANVFFIQFQRATPATSPKAEEVTA